MNDLIGHFGIKVNTYAKSCDKFPVLAFMKLI